MMFPYDEYKLAIEAGCRVNPQERSKTMRNRSHSGRFSRLDVQSYSYAGNSNVNITNITNITKVSNFNVSGNHGMPPKRRPPKKERRLVLPSERERRAPKLQRFCATCGLLDRDVVYGMSEGELCEEAVKALGYNARGLARDVSDIGGGLCRAAGCIAGGLFGVLEAFVNAWD